MRKLSILFLSLLCFVNVFSQSDDTNAGFNPGIIEKSPVLELLYEHALSLEENGTPAEIEANRLAIKAEWQLVNPEVAALYKPVFEGVEYGMPGYNGTPYIPTEIVERPPVSQQRDWTTDLLIRDDFIDGVDMEVADNGDIYIAAYENEIDAGGPVDHIYIYKSIDDGASFTLWKDELTFSPIRKIQLILLSGTGDEYIIAYSLFEGGLLQALRWDLPTATLAIETIVFAEVSDFSVDRSFPITTTNQRVMATYQKGDPGTEVFSARSTLGSYGFGWVDEVSTSSTLGSQIDFAYGRGGATYLTYTGANTGNLYANFNGIYNDPASWGARETVVLGTNQETENPSIVATRKSLATDEVLIFTSSVATGSSLGFNHITYKRENGNNYSLSLTGIAPPNQTNIHIDSWIRRVGGVEIIRTSYVTSFIDNSIQDRTQSFTYDGDFLDSSSRVNDEGNEVWRGFEAAIAETSDNMACLAFAGDNAGNAYGLYFDNEAGVLEVAENAIQGLTYYPNPTKNEFHVKAETVIDEILVYSILGQKVIHIKPGDFQSTINTSGLTSGMFVVQVTSNSLQSTFKIVKE